MVCVGVCEWSVCPSTWVRGIIMYFYTVGTLWQGEIHAVLRTRQATKWLNLGYSCLLSPRMDIIIWPEKGTGHALMVFAADEGIARPWTWPQRAASQASAARVRQCFLAAAGPWGSLTLLEAWWAETAWMGRDCSLCKTCLYCVWLAAPKRSHCECSLCCSGYLCGGLTPRATAGRTCVHQRKSQMEATVTRFRLWVQPSADNSCAGWKPVKGSLFFHVLPQTNKMLPSQLGSRKTSVFSSSSNPAYCCFASECLANGSRQTACILQLYCAPLTEGNPAVPSFWKEQLAKLNRGPLRWWICFYFTSEAGEKGKD